MTNDYISLLNLTYEIEGLLMLHINRGEEAAPEMTQLLKNKIKRLAASFSEQSEPAATTSLPPTPQAVATMPEPTAAPVREPVPVAPIAVSDAEEYDDDFTRPETSADGQAIAASAIEEESEDADVTPDAPLRLEEKLARDRARDIFKAFTINDKFRFRRELFRNSQDEFDETLYIIAQMSNFEEAEEYFYNDLCWNPDSEDVKEFMDIVKKHF